MILVYSLGRLGILYYVRNVGIMFSMVLKCRENTVISIDKHSLLLNNYLRFCDDERSRLLLK